MNLKRQIQKISDNKIWKCLFPFHKFHKIPHSTTNTAYHSQLTTTITLALPCTHFTLSLSPTFHPFSNMTNMNCCPVVKIPFSFRLF